MNERLRTVPTKFEGFNARLRPRGKSRSLQGLLDMAFNVRQNSTFEFSLYFWHSMLQFYNLYLHLQLNIQVSNFSTPIVYLTLFVSRFNFVVWRIQHSSLRNSTSKFTQFNIQLSKMLVFDIQPQASQ